MKTRAPQPERDRLEGVHVVLFESMDALAAPPTHRLGKRLGHDTIGIPRRMWSVPIEDMMWCALSDGLFAATDDTVHARIWTPSYMFSGEKKVETIQE
jgi:hypothetical protein